MKWRKQSQELLKPGDMGRKRFLNVSGHLRQKIEKSPENARLSRLSYGGDGGIRINLALYYCVKPNTTPFPKTLRFLRFDNSAYNCVISFTIAIVV